MSNYKIVKFKGRRYPESLAAPFLFILLTVTAAFGQVAAPDKVPADVADEIAAGRAQDVLVLYDDRVIRNEAEQMRKGLGVEEDTPEILSFKAREYRTLKGNVMSSLKAEEAEIREDYVNLPMAFVRIKSATGLARLQAHPEVVKIFRNDAYHMLLPQSLPLISQPIVASSGKTGKGTAVAVLDTGVDYTKPAFGSCTSPGVPAGCKVVVAKDIAPNDGKLDDSGHGTNVAAIVVGVAPGTHVIALDVFDGSSAYASDIITAIDWCITNKAAYSIVAINMSLGGGSSATPCSGDVFATPVANARSAGIFSAVASGNDGYTNRISSPACVPAALSVGAVYDSNIGSPINWSTCTETSTYADKVTCFSDSASFLTVLAPGSEITAAGTTLSGTSQAAPFIAGSVAVLRGSGAFPSETLTQTLARMTNNGVGVKDTRNGITKPRINLSAAAASLTYSISGTVTGAGGPMAGVTLRLGNGAKTKTNASGAYSFIKLANGTYTITPVLSGYKFTPANVTLTVSGAAIGNKNFTAY